MVSVALPIEAGSRLWPALGESSRPYRGQSRPGAAGDALPASHPIGDPEAPAYGAAAERPAPRSAPCRVCSWSWPTG